MYLPKISVSGSYTRIEKDLALLVEKTYKEMLQYKQEYKDLSSLLQPIDSDTKPKVFGQFKSPEYIYHLLLTFLPFYSSNVRLFKTKSDGSKF